MADYLDVIIWSLFGGLVSVLGGIIIISNRKLADKVSRVSAPFAAGALLGAAFFDLLPEAIEIDTSSVVFRWAILGLIIFFLLEHYLHWFHHHHEHDGENRTFKKPTSTLIIIGDTIHNLIDGVVIGAAFLVSVPLGIITAIAVAAHEIPQEIGDFGILLKTGMRRSRVLFWNVLSSLATVTAAIYTFWLGSNQSLPLAAILGVSAGMFIYIAASDLIPTIHEESKDRFARTSVILLISGVLVVGLATDIAHDYLNDQEGTHSESGAQVEKTKHDDADTSHEH
jgi:zinc and cadmium transporter